MKAVSRQPIQRLRIRYSALAALVLVLASLMACTPNEGTVRGVVTSVEGSFEDITAFTVLVEGSEVRFEVVEDGDYGFPLSHLREHMRTGQPVFVEWELVGTVHYALSLTDG